MYKELTLKLRPLMDPAVEQSLRDLLNYRRDMHIKDLIRMEDSEARGAIKEIDYLLEVRQRIIDAQE